MNLSGLRLVTRKRGLALPWVHSALAITRRRRFQLPRVDHMKSRNTRAGALVLSERTAASARAPVTLASKRALRARPKT